MLVKVVQKINSLLDIFYCITVIYFDHVFRSHCLYPSNFKYVCITYDFCPKDPIQRFYSHPFPHIFMN